MPQIKDIEESSKRVETPRIYRFEDFQIDIVEETLHRKGEKLRINRRTFQILQLLVERAGKIISKQEFFETVWVDTFVEDNSLTVTMTALRKILGDDSKQPRFIENLPRKGYRFISEVKLIDNEPMLVVQINKNDEKPIPETQKSRKISKNRKIHLVIGAGCLLFLLTVLSINYRSFSNIAVSSQKTNQIESIAVFPFENQNPDTEYFSDGLTESLINGLSRLPELRVISRNSVFQYKGKSANSMAIGRELNVRTILTGRFVERGDDLIVSAELTDVRNDKQIWGRQYNRKKSDAFALQQEITRDISETLRAKLSGEERQRIAKRETDSPEAFLLYLKGRYHFNKRSAKDFEKGVEFFKQAIDRDPTYALAYVGLANCYLLAGLPYDITLKERVAMIKDVADKALEIDPTLGEVHATLAINHHFNEWDWASAEREYKLAVELSPNYATAHHWYAEFLATEGRFDESFVEYQRALELDPLSLAISTDLGMTYYYARQFDRAIEHFEKLKKIDPNYVRTYIFLSKVYVEKGLFVEAITEGNKGLALAGEDLQTLAERKTMLENAVRTSGAKGFWQKVLELKPDSVTMARAYSELNEQDKAFEFLEKGYNGRQGILVSLKVSPEFDSLRSDPRFTDLMRRVGIPQ